MIITPRQDLLHGWASISLSLRSALMTGREAVSVLLLRDWECWAAEAALV